MVESVANDRAVLKAIVGQLMIAAVAFVLAAGVWEWAINRLHARPVIPEPFKTKIDLFLNGPHYDTAFVGSSRFFHGIDPTAFDAQTARRGLATHSYNLAFDAMDFPELRFVVQHVLSDPRAHLKYLFVEASLRVRLAPGLEQSQRAITLHDAKSSEYIAELVLRGNQDWQRKLFWLYEQGSVSAIRLTNVGALTNFYVHPQEPPQDAVELIGPTGNGYYPLHRRDPLAPQVTDNAIGQLVVEHQHEQLIGEGRRLNDFEISQLTALQAEAASHGTKLILLAMPTAAPEAFGEFTAFRLAKMSGQLTIPFITFADPAAYPEVYQPDGFVDAEHVKRGVSLILSAKTADQFVDLLGAPH